MAKQGHPARKRKTQKGLLAQPKKIKIGGGVKMPGVLTGSDRPEGNLRPSKRTGRSNQECPRERASNKTREKLAQASSKKGQEGCWTRGIPLRILRGEGF